MYMEWGILMHEMKMKNTPQVFEVFKIPGLGKWYE